MRIEIDIEDTNGVRLGPGPITTASSWQHTRRLDRAGAFSFLLPAADSRRQYIQARRIARCWGVENGQRQELGAGIVDALEFVGGNPPVLRVSGDDLLRELTYRSVGNLALYDTVNVHPAMILRSPYPGSGGGAKSLALAYDLAVGDTLTADTTLLGWEEPSHTRIYLTIHAAHTFSAVVFVLGAQINNNVVDIGAEYWNAEGDAPDWEILSITDGTAVAGAPFAQSGTISFEPPPGWGIAAGESTYKIRIWTSTYTDNIDFADIAITRKRATTTALAQAMALAPASWQIDAVNGYTSTAKEELTGSELISNGDLEAFTGTLDDSITDVFTGWTNDDNGGANVIDATATTHAGSAAVKIHQSGSVVEGNALLFQDVAVAEKADYQIAFWTRGDGTAQAAYRIQDTTTFAFLSPPVDTGITGATYTYFRDVFTTPPGCTGVRIAIYGPWYTYPGTMAYVDDISVKRRLGSGEVHLTMAGETVLETLVRIAQQTGQHFILSYTGRRVLWLGGDQRTVALRAISDIDASAVYGNDDVCLIRDLQEIQNSYETCTRIYPYGGGIGSARVTLADTTRTAPTGYTLDKTNNYLVRDAAETGALPRVDKWLDFPDINPINTLPDQRIQAANMLFDRAYEYLRTHSFTDADPVTGDVPRLYALTVTKANRVIWPGHKLRVDYRRWLDGYNYLSINIELWILSATTVVDSTGVRTVSLEASTVDALPDSDASTIANEIRASRAFRAHSQAEQGLNSEGAGTINFLAIRDGRVTGVRKG